jgi:hypothetical protein
MQLYLHKKNIYKNLSKSMTNLIWQLQNRDAYSIAKIEILQNDIA